MRAADRTLARLDREAAQAEEEYVHHDVLLEGAGMLVTVFFELFDGLAGVEELGSRKNAFVWNDLHKEEVIQQLLPGMRDQWMALSLLIDDLHDERDALQAPRTRSIPTVR